MSGVAGDGKAIICENNNGLRWERPNDWPTTTACPHAFCHGCGTTRAGIPIGWRYQSKSARWGTMVTVSED